ncbi:MAG TPA: sugar ABC transporter ATP-binding protein, partial [Lachnospiraceae bacterium]|nr:sugar ABC transporter ATP-binding protein [Lachnospiraceae bacterium]
MAGYTCREDVFLHAEKISKIYPGTLALNEVSFDLLKGKVNVLIGENGAGKSTLMKMIAGIEQPSRGKMYIGSTEVHFKDTIEARKQGIGIIHQELSLFPNLNVYQNIYMNKEKTHGLLLDNAKHIEGAGRVLERLQHPLDLNARVGELRVGQQQMIEIARNLVDDDLKVLIMDEPTSSLSEQEVQILFKIMRELTASGISIVYISHRLEEIMEIGDHVTVLRDGQYVADADVKDISIPWIVEKMTGGKKNYPKRDRRTDWSQAETVLSVKDLCLPKPGGGYLVDHVSFDLKKGEVLGIYGLLGAGRSEIFECIMGMRPEHTGQIIKNGKQVKVTDISRMIAEGFAMIPEDRQGMGLVQTLSVEKNTSLSVLTRYIKGGIFIDEKKENEMVDKEIRDIHIKVNNKKLPILSLSGGNQQKV